MADEADDGTDGSDLSSLVIVSIVSFLLRCVVALYLTIPGLSDLMIRFFSIFVSTQPADNVVDYYWSLEVYERECIINVFVASAMLIAIVLKKILHRVTFLPEDLLGCFIFCFIVGFGFMKNTFL